MTGRRCLIVNADDFGLAAGVNRGIIEAHQRGIVTSASLMVRAACAEEAADLAMANPALGLGLHLDLGEWIYRDGEWIAAYQYVKDGDVDAEEAEVESQVARFTELIGRAPDHIDSHQHVHLSSPSVSDAVMAAARRLGVGVRSRHPDVGYLGMYGQDRDGSPLPDYISPDGYIAAIRELPLGWTELACHPGYADGLDSDYLAEREIEVGTLCDPSLKVALAEAGVELTTWDAVGFDTIAAANIAIG
ncbi:MAG TPA: ChbG/HpnK family deacetylase [Candidatus Solibacter sp.]|jgi:predicted glycoside hydrolase/deacetylase ChbG (UPF0249 family)|nr:ChbG/HpnK family deacetylase [Candidatus Solibacter sp.]